MTIVPIEDATIAVTSPLPAPAGSEVVVRVVWPRRPAARAGSRSIGAPTRRTGPGIVASAPVARRPWPTARRCACRSADAAPSFDGAGLHIDYVVRVLVDRRFRNDAAIERPIGIV
jgi:hypothetical protein